MRTVLSSRGCTKTHRKRLIGLVELTLSARINLRRSDVTVDAEFVDYHEPLNLRESSRKIRVSFTNPSVVSHNRGTIARQRLFYRGNAVGPGGPVVVKKELKKDLLVPRMLPFGRNLTRVSHPRVPSYLLARFFIPVARSADPSLHAFMDTVCRNSSPSPRPNFRTLRPFAVRSEFYVFSDFLDLPSARSCSAESTLFVRHEPALRPKKLLAATERRRYTRGTRGMRMRKIFQAVKLHRQG